MTKPTVISLFAGAGGLDYGLEAAGFRTRVGVEMDADCCETLRGAKRKWEVIEKRIGNVSAKELLEKGGLKPGQADLVAGGPPCQPFSKASFWVRGEAPRFDDPRAGTVRSFMRVVEAVRPRVVLLENVEGFAFENGDEGLQHVLARLKDINKVHGTKYEPVSEDVQCADYGVPQTRTRRILVAARDGTLFKFPKPTHGDGPGLIPYRTAWDALGDEEPDEEDLELGGKWAGLLPSIPEGQNYLFHTSRGGGLDLFGWRTRFWTFLLKLAKNRPSWTIQAHPGPSAGPFHWANRRLSIKELCRLQTFPDDVEIKGGRISQHKQVGNAVPSLLAEVIGRAIRVQLLGLPSIRGPLRLHPKQRLPIPRKTPRREVPSEFLSHVGTHPDHPGAGKGPGAKTRQKEAKAA